MEVTTSTDDPDVETTHTVTSCPGDSSPVCVCANSQCCGETNCYIYYDLWWFWVFWMLLVVFSCCCVIRHRRLKLRLQQQRQRDIELMLYQQTCRYTHTHLQLSFLPPSKLPSYEEAAAESRAPPPSYTAAGFVLQGGALPVSHSLGTFSSSSSESSSLFSSFAPTDDMMTSGATTPSDPGDTRVTLGDARVTLGDARVTLGDARVTPGDTRVTLGDARVTLGDTRVTLGDTGVTLGDTRVTFGDARVTLGDTRVTLGDTRVTLGDTRVTFGDARFNSGDTRVTLGDARVTSGDTRVTSGDTRVTPGDQASPQNQPDPVTPPLPHSQGAELSSSSEHGVESSRKATPPRLKHTLFSSSVCVLEIEGRGSQEDLKENSFRLRTLTGDSGIEVCRCRVIPDDDDDDDEEEEEARVGGALHLHDSADCPRRNLSDQSDTLNKDCNRPDSASSSQRGGDSVAVELS